MLVQATVNPSEANGLKTSGAPSIGLAAGNSRKVSIEFNLGKGWDNTDEGARTALEDAILEHGVKAVYANWVKGAKLPLQAKLRQEGDIQTADDGSLFWKTDAEIAESFNDFKLPDEVTEPKSEEDKAIAAWEKLSPEVRARLLRLHGQ